MPVAEALRWCSNLIVLPPNYPLYHELSHKLKLLFEKGDISFFKMHSPAPLKYAILCSKRTKPRF